jgi:hypothetical protein
MRSLALTALAIASALTTQVQAAPPPATIGYKGFLADSSGNPIASDTKTIGVALYGIDVGGSPLYVETHAGVAITQGRFDLTLGGGVPVTGAFANVSFAQALWLELTVGTETLSPRIPFSTVPYARTTLQIGTQASGKWCSSDGSVINCQQDAPGGISTITAGAGLTGGGSSSTVNLALNTAGAVTLTGNWVNTANPWADDEVADNLTISGGSISNSTGSFTSLTLADGSQGAGKVLVSDASGKGAWQNLSSGGTVSSVTASAPLSVTNGTTTPSISLGTVPVNKGGTGATSLTGYLVGNGTGAVTASATIPATAISGSFTTLNAATIVSGSSDNVITAEVQSGTAFIGGGGISGSPNKVTDSYGVVLGGYANVVGNNNGVDDAIGSVVAGGFHNTASGGGDAVIGGGGSTASGGRSSVLGGQNNTASGFQSALVGGDNNSVNSESSVILGGKANTIAGVRSVVGAGFGNRVNGNYSFAAGTRTIVNSGHDGTFLWADNNFTDFGSVTANEFAVRASGGVRFVTIVGGNTGCSIAPGGGAWNCTSDRNAKQDFSPVDGRAVLEKVAAMPIQTWRYKTEVSQARHMGPMAQDFRAAFNLGDDDKTIATVDPDGVALAAIQGLNALLQEQRKLIEAQRAEIAELKTQNQRVSERLQRVESHFVYTQR